MKNVKLVIASLIVGIVIAIPIKIYAQGPCVMCYYNYSEGRNLCQLAYADPYEQTCEYTCSQVPQGSPMPEDSPGWFCAFDNPCTVEHIENCN